MRELDHEERRRHPRIQLVAYGFNHICRVRSGSSAFDAALIDISPGGARLKLGDDLKRPLEKGDRLSVNPRIAANPSLNRDIDALARWTAGREIGVQFLEELEIAASDLQKLLAK